MTQLFFAINKIAVIGVPSSAGARQPGQERAPERLRDAGLVERLHADGFDVTDRGDLELVRFAPDSEHPKQQNLSLVRRVVENVASAVDASLGEGAWPLVIGGDCTISIGVLAALARRSASVGLVYFDGDVDLNTPETTVSGIFDGMVLAHVLGRGAPGLSRCGPRHPLLDERDVVLFGYSADAGGVDPVEIELLKRARMRQYPLESIAESAESAADQALVELEGRAERILLHFDVDVIDADDFPAVDVPHKPGLGLAQAQQALARFLASPKIAGLVVAEFNPRDDADGSLARRLVDTLSTALRRAKRRATRR